MNANPVVNTRLNLKFVSIIFLVVISFVFIDISISSLVDIYHDFSYSMYGILLFLVVTGVLFSGTYIILKTTTDKLRSKYVEGTFESKATRVVWAVYCLMVIIMVFVILQLFIFSDYFTSLLLISPSISYGLATYFLGVLAYRFFSWFRRKRSLVVLLYGLASALASIYTGLLIAIFYVEIFSNHPLITTIQSAGSWMEITPGFIQILIVALPQILTAAIFLSFWGGTIAILHVNIRRIGKITFWTLVITPIVFFLGTLISLFPDFQGAAPQGDPNSIIIPVYITNISQVIAIGLFATAFVSMARAIPHNQISYYMYITCYGLSLFSIGIIATISGAGYPPFGLPSVSLVGIFSFLLFTGLNHSAISTAQDSNLRWSIKVTAERELKLLDNIGAAEMEKRLEKKVLEATKSYTENLTKQSGIEPTLSINEAKQYLLEVINEAKNRNKKSLDDDAGISSINGEHD